MAGTTTELALSTAVDTDDTADYLTLNLANSLRTIDALFNNVSGHTHASAHQGGPIAASALRGAFDIPDWFRSTGHTSVFAGSGVGIELYWSGTVGTLQSFNRATAAYAATDIWGSPTRIGANGSPGITVNADNTVTMASNATVSGALTVAGAVTAGGPLTLSVGTINLAAGIVITNDGNNVFYRATASGAHIFSHTDGSAATVAASIVNASSSMATPTLTITNGGTIDSGPAGYVKISQLTVTPGTTALAGASVNGTLSVSGTSSLTGAVTCGAALTATSLTSSGGALNFNAGGTVSIVWDNTYLRHSHSIIFNTTGNQVVWPNGSYISGNAGYVQGSQSSLKEAITPIPDSEAMIRVADPRMVVSSYTWPGDTRQSLGFMAENVAEVLPNYVIRDEDGTPTGYVPQELVAILWGAVRDLNARVQTLEAA